MHRLFIALVSAVVFTSALAASIVALGPSSWIPIEASAAEVSEGKRLFDHETFGGNGRTCRTCHSGNDGTISLEEVTERLRTTPQTHFSFMTASTISSAARPASPPTPRS